MSGASKVNGTATSSDERLAFANRCGPSSALAARLAPYRSQAPVVLGLVRNRFHYVGATP